MSDHATSNAAAWLKNIRDMVTNLSDAEQADDMRAIDEAREAIQQSPLSVEVRDGWRVPGTPDTDREAEEYRILLTTGGPALRIVGELGQYNEPDSATLQWQDWGTPWTEYVAPDGKTDNATLLAFSRQFYFEDC